MNEYIDSTLLRSDATIEDITKLCEDAMKYHFATVCVNPYYVPLAKELLSSSTVGASTTNVKVYEAVDAIEAGADEIDMVINIGALKDKEYEYVKKEIEQVRNVLDGKVLKVIIETCYLTKEEIIKATEICNETFVNFIKTSTGFGSRGASIEDIKIINEHKNEVLEVKASGGIKTREDAETFLKLGVTRIGTSNGAKMMEGCQCSDECHCGDNCQCGDDCHCGEHCHCHEEE